MFVQKRCLFDTYVLQKKKLRRKFRDSLTLQWMPDWRMRLFYMSGERRVIMGPNYRQSSMLHMQIPTINISLQHYCYKSLDVCPYVTSFQLQPKDFTVQSISLTLENHLYRYFCVAAMIMMLIHASKFVTLVCNHTDIASI